MGNEYLNNTKLEDAIKKFQVSKRQKSRYELIIEDLTESQERRKKRNKNKKRGQCLAELLQKNSDKYQKTCHEFITSSDDLAIYFLTLSQNIVQWAKFDFIDDDDAIQEGVMICFEKIDRFDPNYVGKNGKKAKAFNYMTTCIFNHFRQLYRTARNYQEFKNKYLIYLQNQLEKIALRNGKLHSTSMKIIPVDNSRQRLNY
jgi:hypothetical protein